MLIVYQNTTAIAEIREVPEFQVTIGALTECNFYLEPSSGDWLNFMYLFLKYWLLV